MDDHTVTGRVLAVLDTVADLADGATLAALTRSTGIPKPTVRRIAADLVTRGLLERRGDRYRLGLRMLELGTRAAAQHGIRLAATPYLQDLFARTREFAWIGILSDTTCTIIASAFGPVWAAELRRNPWPTAVHSADFLMTAAGWVVLADQPRLVEHLKSRPLRRSTGYPLALPPQIDAELNRIRDTGLAIEHDRCKPGYSCITVGLRDQSRSLVGIIGVTGRTSSFAAERFTRPMLTAASEITRTFVSPVSLARLSDGEQLRNPYVGRKQT